MFLSENELLETMQQEQKRGKKKIQKYEFPRKNYGEKKTAEKYNFPVLNTYIPKIQGLKMVDTNIDRIYYQGKHSNIYLHVGIHPHRIRYLVMKS